MESMKRSRLPNQANYIYLGIGVLPIAFIRFALSFATQSGSISNFRIPFDDLSFPGNDVDGIMFALGLNQGHIGNSNSFMSYRLENN